MATECKRLYLFVVAVKRLSSLFFAAVYMLDGGHCLYYKRQRPNGFTAPTWVVQVKKKEGMKIRKQK